MMKTVMVLLEKRCWKVICWWKGRLLMGLEAGAYRYDLVLFLNAKRLIWVQA